MSADPPRAVFNAPASPVPTTHEASLPVGDIDDTLPTIWGLDPIALHDRFWAARGVFVVRHGETCLIPDDAELYLLTDPQTLAVFRLAPLLDVLSWVQPSVLFLRLAATLGQDYREVVVTDRNGQFERFRRLYRGAAECDHRVRLALTRDRGIATVWQTAPAVDLAWRALRRQSRSAGRETVRVRGRLYSRTSPTQLASLTTDLLNLWGNPGASVPNLKSAGPRVWCYRDTPMPRNVRFVGGAWIGAGRRIASGTTVLGPAILWDDPAHRPAAADVSWSELEPGKSLVVSSHTRTPTRPRRGPQGKRLFDFVFALCTLLVTLPFYPLIMFAIWIEDGRPFFFVHRRQTLGGREFPCIKFRSMRRDAEVMKQRMAKANRADGPQFFFVDDPRSTRVGKFLRKTQLDEIPQFINILLGHMSVVGPRPSPSSENQFNPAWREARLSVRAGLTGLWQVRRTRRPGLDFQEWIKYDMEYVHNASWWLDLSIIARTIQIVLGGGGR